MSKKNLVFIIVAEQGYLRSIDNKEDFSEKNDILFTAISDTYIPLLNMFSRLEDENIPFKVGIVLSAPLCSLLDDPQIQKQYIDWLDRKIAFGNSEINRCHNNNEILKLSMKYLLDAQKNKIDFTEVYEQKLLDKFKYFADKGFIELIPTAATFAFLPHYKDYPEVINAQIETGIYSHRHYFGETGEGFWLPFTGWTNGLEKNIRSYGLNYTILETQSFLFSEKAPELGIFAPARCDNSLVVFAKDSDTIKEINGTSGYCHNNVYRSQQRDAGFDLEHADLTAFSGKQKTRVQTGFKYYSNNSDSGVDSIYNINLAEEQAKQDAITFYNSKSTKLLKAHEIIKSKDISLVCELNAEFLGQSWYEGIIWFEQVLRLINEKNEVSTELCKNLIANQYSLQKITPYPCASYGTGYGEDLLDNSNGWMLRYIRKASERMIDLTERFPSDTGLKARLLNLGAKELLLAQSGDWPKMIHEKRLNDFVSDEFKKNILAFTTVFDSLGSNTVSTEWLTELEKEHALFPWINYRIFSKKK